MRRSHGCWPGLEKHDRAQQSRMITHRKVDPKGHPRVCLVLMRSHLNARLFLIVLLLLLFTGLSFNAYACLVPLFGATSATMGNGCSTPGETPVHQFCDAFKVMSVQAPSDSSSDLDSHSINVEASISFIHSLNHQTAIHLSTDHPGHAPPRDLLIEIRVLRI